MAKTLKTNEQIDSHLLNADKNFNRIIEHCGAVEIRLADNYFGSLARSIIGQQLSNKVAKVMWERFFDLMNGNPEPEKLLNADHAKLRDIGLSTSKIRYLGNLSEAILSENLILEDLPFLEDSQVIEKLTSIKGIGPWTADMFMIFSLGCQDIFSTKDLGLKRAIQWLYKMDEKPDLEQLVSVSEKWSPYRTFASLYLWEVVDRKPFEK